MNPEEVLQRAMAMLVSEEFAPIIEKALENAKDLATATATLVYPIVFRLQQETDVPDEEMFGTEEGDGIAIHLMQEIFDIAGEAGLLEGGDEQSIRAEAEKAVQLLQELMQNGQGATHGDPGAQGMPQGQPMPQGQQQSPQGQPRGLMAGVA